MSNRPLAVVTGASDGMGKEFARQLAAQGNDLLLIARRGNLLDELKEELESSFAVSVEIMALDLSVLENIERLEKKVQNSNSLLWMVNAAGFGSGGAPFPNASPEIETQMLILHTIAPMRLCRSALVPMNANRRGFIINIASVAAWLASKGAADYSASKAFLVAFSKALQCDCRDSGVRIQAFCPGFVRTGFHSSQTMKRSAKFYEKIPNFMWDRPERVVRKSIREAQRQVGRRVVFIPSFFYWVLSILASCPPFMPLRILISRGTMR